MNKISMLALVVLLSDENGNIYLKFLYILERMCDYGYVKTAKAAVYVWKCRADEKRKKKKCYFVIVKMVKIYIKTACLLVSTDSSFNNTCCEKEIRKPAGL